MGLSRFLLRARTPDDYDSIGFVLALDRYDLTRQQPHFPGYPVYVALARGARAVLVQPLDAAAAISAVAAGATAWGLYVIGRRVGGSRVGALAGGSRMLRGIDDFTGR